MYDVLYSAYYGGKGNRFDLEVFIIPRFGIVFNKEADERLYWYSDKYGMMKDECLETKEIKLEEGVKWVVCVNSEYFYQVYVTERRSDIWTDLDKGLNFFIMEKVKDAKREYQMEKMEQRRLYFYDATERRLVQHYVNMACDCKLRYDLNREAYQQIDKNFLSLMEKDCFVLGRVRRTIWNQEGKQVDFIEPVSKFWIDLLGEETDKFGEVLFGLLQCLAQKVHSSQITTRVSGKMKCTMSEFLENIRRALDSGDVEQVKFLYKVLMEPQDCSKEKFRILENAADDSAYQRENIECNAKNGIWIQYENGEKERKSIRWIEENIARCLTKRFSYYVI